MSMKPPVTEIGVIPPAGGDSANLEAGTGI
jgi:hypothetical protein